MKPSHRSDRRAAAKPPALGKPPRARSAGPRRAAGPALFLALITLVAAAPTGAQEVPEPSDARREALRAEQAAERAEAAAEAAIPGQPGSWSPPDDVVRFYILLPKVLQEELEVQRFERASLGKEPIEDLRGHRLRRRQRIDDDAAHFRTRASLFSLRLRGLPGNADIAAAVAEGRQLGALELTLISAVGTVYAEVAQPRALELIRNHNKTFLKEVNWARRDEAVRQRDELMERLERFEPVLVTAWEILGGELEQEDLDALLAELTELAPDADIGTGNLSKLVLADERVRDQVLAEMRAEMAALDHRFVPLEPEDELRQRLSDAQTTLIKRSDLVDVLLEDGDLSKELAEVEARLADEGVNALDPDERRELLQRKTDILLKRKQLQAAWRHTPPAQPFADEFMDAQDALLRHRLAALGSRGALFVQRYLELRDERGELDPEVPADTWDFLTEQAALSEEALAAVPPPDPRLGLDLRPKVLLDPATRAKQQQLINLLKKATASKSKAGAGALGPLPKPRKGGKKP